MDRSYYTSFPEVDYQEADQAIMVAIQVSSDFTNEVFKGKLMILASEDKNMGIRNTAIKTLKHVYGYQS